MQVKLWVVAAVAIGLAACNWKEHNPYFCPSGQDCASIGPPCRVDDDCDAPLVCDTEAEMCVQCTPEKLDACTVAMPACGDDGRCRACEAHSECSASEACLPDGTCADAAKVAYVKPTALGGTDNGACTLAMPCTKVTKALATGRAYVKFAGMNNEGAAVTIVDQNVSLLAERDAKLVRTTNGVILEVRGTSQVEIFDLEITGASGGGNSGISLRLGYSGTLTLTRVKLLNNTGGGVSLEDGGTINVSQSTFSGNVGGGITAKNGVLNVSQSTIADNVAGGVSTSGGSLTLTRSTLSGNPGGGLSVTTGGAFVIVGNVFFNNGTQTGNAGGINISTVVNSMNRLEFNSFVRNTAQDGLGAAMQCAAGTFTARNNIMSNNGTLSNLEQFTGTCLNAYSIARPGTVPPGVGNSGMDPLFKDSASGDLHLNAGSPALGAADPVSALTGPARLDIDGDQRQSPADIGADEVP